MTAKSGAWLRHALLAGVPHGFGTRGSEPPRGLVRAKQVHGTRIVEATQRCDGFVAEADGIVCRTPGLAIAVVTADCMPLLLATPSGVVAAIHAGWRGLASGVIAAGIEALGRIAADADRAVAVIGPHIGASCYEVDAPVVRALEARFGDAVAATLRETRPGHHEIALAPLASLDLVRAGLAPERVAIVDDACTMCDAERFHSYRRDGPDAGRLFHYVIAAARSAT
ncbi:MAG: laccase domain-containing protein [Proteobacteria bacterium]|nr:MAG: laccase domain-containing protein [Pseudomonadota bacterium]